MSLTIWKYTIEITDKQVILLPRDAKILAVQEQYSAVYLWALVNPSKPEEGREIRIFGTGRPVDADELTYIGTVQQRDKVFVWHVFEAK